MKKTTGLVFNQCFIFGELQWVTTL